VAPVTCGQPGGQSPPGAKEDRGNEQKDVEKAMWKPMWKLYVRKMDTADE